jgi:DNA-directed RNA polymerase subunit RPC12/RpoP
VGGFFHGEQGMAIFVDCPVCAETLQAPDDAAGKGCRCPLCESLVTIPLDEPTQPVHAAEPQRRLRRRFRCPYCDSRELPIETRRISSAGWIIFGVFLVFFSPLFWVGLLITEPETRCYDCRRQLF